jgi:chromatin remodeling complex protein RSC6
MAETQKHHKKSKKGIEIPDVAEVISSSKKERTESKEERRERRSKRHREKASASSEVAAPSELAKEVVVAPEVSEVVVEAPVKEKKKRKAKVVAPSEGVVKEEGVVEEVVVEEVVVEADGKEGKAAKFSVDRLQIESAFDVLLADVNQEIEALKEDKVNMKNPIALAHIKSCRLISKKLKQLKVASLRMIRKPRPKRQSNASSGFLKPVPISEEMAKFTGWDPSELKSRVDVTSFIWKYVKDNGLQNPEDGRQFKPDAKLGSLLSQDTDKPLMYYNLTSKIQPHFPKQQA